MSVFHPTQINRRDFKALDSGENDDFKGTFGRGEIQCYANMFGRLISYCALVACMTDFAWSRFTFYQLTKFYTGKVSCLTLLFLKSNHTFVHSSESLSQQRILRIQFLCKCASLLF